MEHVEESNQEKQEKPEQETPRQETKPEEKKQEPKKQFKPKKEKGPGLITKIKDKLAQYNRVLYVTQKPDKDEFLGSLRTTLLGIFLVGFIGFAIYLIYNLVF